jgi:hypothetical protein
MKSVALLGSGLPPIIEPRCATRGLLTYAPRFSLGYKSGRAFRIECVRGAKLSQCFLFLPSRQEYVEVRYDGEHHQYQERGSCDDKPKHDRDKGKVLWVSYPAIGSRHGRDTTGLRCFEYPPGVIEYA